MTIRGRERSGDAKAFSWQDPRGISDGKELRVHGDVRESLYDWAVWGLSTDGEKVTVTPDKLFGQEPEFALKTG